MLDPLSSQRVHPVFLPSINDTCTWNTFKKESTITKLQKKQKNDKTNKTHQADSLETFANELFLSFVEGYHHNTFLSSPSSAGTGNKRALQNCQERHDLAPVAFRFGMRRRLLLASTGEPPQTLVNLYSGIRSSTYQFTHACSSR